MASDMETFCSMYYSSSLFVCVEVLRPSQPNGACRARSVNLTTRLLGRHVGACLLVCMREGLGLG